jgi:hypothetical protein
LFFDSVNPDADAFYNMAPVLVNRRRGQRPEFTPRPVLSSGYPLSSSRMMNLSPFVGTGLSFASELTLSKDNVDLIKVANRLVDVHMISYSSVQRVQKGTHRITMMKSLPVDSETLVLATLALAVAVGVAWRVRRVAPGVRLARRDAYEASSRDAKPQSDRARWGAASPVVLDLGADFFGERPGGDGDHGTRNAEDVFPRSRRTVRTGRSRRRDRHGR